MMLIAGCFLGFLENILATIEGTWTEPKCCDYRLFGELFWITHTSENKTMIPYLSISFVMNLIENKKTETIVETVHGPQSVSKPITFTAVIYIIIIIICLCINLLLCSKISFVFIDLLYLHLFVALGIMLVHMFVSVVDAFPFCN